MEKFKWASRILAGLSGLLALALPTTAIPAVAIPWLGLVVAALAFASRWCEQQLPSTTVQAVNTAVAAGSVAVDGVVVVPPQVVVTDPPPVVAGPTVKP